MKRRLKAEITSKKKYSGMSQTLEEAQEFEQSLVKLAHLSKGKIKISNFSASDKTNLLDLFVNNEKTLLKIFEALFPT